MTTAPAASPGARADTARRARIARSLERHSWIALAALAAVLAYSVAIRARAKPFWHDEIYTILHADLPGLRAMWAAALDGFDLSPPFNTLLTRAVHTVAGAGPIATRVPPLAGYLVMTAVVFHLIRTRANAAAALAGALLPAFTAAYRYSYEARGYGVMVGLFALALYAWSEAARRPRRGPHLVLLGLTLAASVWNHYYGALAFVPIAAGEAVRTMQRRRFDPGMAAAIAAGVLLSLPLYPLAAAAGTQSQTFWAPATFSELGGIYRFLLNALTERPTLIAGAIVAVLCVVWRRPARDRVNRRIPAHEVAAGITSLLIPVIGVALGLAVTGVFAPRYAMTFVVGLSLVCPLLVWQRQTRGGAAEFLLCGFLAASFAYSIWPSLLSPPEFRDPFLTRPVLSAAVSTGPPPIVVASSLQFLQYWYYTPDALKGRLRYLADPDAARTYQRFDTIDRGYLALRRWTAVPIDLYDEHVAAAREIRVYESGSGWLLRKMAEIGASRTEAASAAGERLYIVTMPDTAR